MSSTNKTALGLNMWEASDKPVRQDFVNDNSIIDEKITQLNSNLHNVNSNLSDLSSNFQLGNAVLKFTVGYNSSLKEPYLIIEVGSQLYYQLTLKATTIQYGKMENSVWKTIWEK